MTNTTARFGVSDDRRTTFLEQLTARNGWIRGFWTTNNCNGFQAYVRCEGYADTQIEWVKENGVLLVPDSYTLQLDRAPQIGGTVVDQQGFPIAGAEVKFFGPRGPRDFPIPIPGTHQPKVSVSVLSPALQNVLTNIRTDDQGRWSWKHMASQFQEAGFIIQVSHPDFQTDRSDTRKDNPLPALQSGEYVSVLVRHYSSNIVGAVQDFMGTPLVDAEITDGTLYSNPRTSTKGDTHVRSDAHGKFSFTSRHDWDGKVTVKARGFAAQTLQWNRQPLTFNLPPGSPLHLRIVNKSGEPIEGVRIVSQRPMQNNGTNPPTHFSLQEETDSDGRLWFEDAPNEPLRLHFYDYSHKYSHRLVEAIKPSQEVQTIVLEPATKADGF